jgi:hypothetical protein
MIGVGSALAAQQVISTGGPINNIWLNDNLACQATHVGDTANEFFGGTNPGACGTFLATGGTAYGPSVPAGFSGTGFTPAGQTSVTGAGTASNPFQVVTTVNVGTTGLQITQTDSYVVGQEQYRTDIAVHNFGSASASATLYHTGDCFLQGSDVGFGAVNTSGGVFCTANPNNSPPARIVGFQPLTGGSNYVESVWPSFWNGITGAGAQYPNTCDCTTREDNGAGLSWPLSIPAGGATTVSLSTIMSPTGGVVAGKPFVNTGTGTAGNSTSAAFTGSVNPDGLQTTAVVQYGLDPSYAGGGPVVYTNQVAASPSPVGSDFSFHPVTGGAGGLVPNALYHFRVVATNSAGTTFGSDQTFRTKKDSSTPAPALGKSFNMTPVSGRMFVKFSGSQAGGSVSVSGPGFVPCLETCHLPAGTQVDSRFGKFKIQSASGKKGKLFSGTFGGAIVTVSQARKGSDKGLTTFRLRLGVFPGAPTLKSCAVKKTSRDPLAQIASLSYAYRSSSHGRYRTRYGRASGSSSGTKWDTIVRCSGVLFRVFRGTVVVNDSGRHKIVSVSAGHSYLAKR